MPNPAKSATAPKSCICSEFANVVTGERIACFSTTKGLFAPGHDAKLKGLLIRAGIKDQMISDGIVGEFTSAEISGRFGFYSKVMEGIRKGKEAAAPAEAPAPAPEAVPAPKKARVNGVRIYSATYGDVTGTRTSKTRVYTHAAVYMVHGGEIVIGSWHSSEALAAKGVNGLKPVAVVAVTAS